MVDARRESRGSGRRSRLLPACGEATALGARLIALRFRLADRGPGGRADRRCRPWARRIGRSDKVAALLRDFGEETNCSRIDEMTAEWLFERLCTLAAAPSRRSTGGP